MSTQERLAADYSGTGLTVGRHPMHFVREALNELGVTRAADLPGFRNGGNVKVAGCVIVRQRPGTAKGIAFLSLEDETGISNIVVMPDLFMENKLVIVTSPYLMIDGRVQNMDGVIHVLAKGVARMEEKLPAMASHDFR